MVVFIGDIDSKPNGVKVGATEGESANVAIDGSVNVENSGAYVYIGDPPVYRGETPTKAAGDGVGA